MQIVMKNGSIQHVSAEVAQTLIAAGMADEVKQQTETKKVPSIKFTAARGFIEGDYEHPPRIFYTTGCCGDKGVCSSNIGKQNSLCGHHEEAIEHIML